MQRLAKIYVSGFLSGRGGIQICSFILVLTMSVVLSTKMEAAEIGGFPVSIVHALGTTTIPEKPRRIVALGWNSEDVLLALGEHPIAIQRRPLFRSGIFPWVEDRLGPQKPLLLRGPIADFENIALLKPDLILAIHSGVDLREYSRLSRIAPTVVYRSGPWRADWREQTELIGLATGLVAEAENLIQSTDAFIAKLRDSHSELSGLSFTFGRYSAGASTVTIYPPWTQSVRMLQDLGMVVPTGVHKLATFHKNRIWMSVSKEQLDLVDSDISIWWFDPAERAAFEKDGLLHTMEAMRRKAFVGIDDPSMTWGVGALSVLSIPYVYPAIAERLSNAARHVRRR